MEEVTPRAQIVDAECLPKQFFDTEWEIPKDICIDNIQICNYWLSFSKRNEPVIDPTSSWKMIFRDGTELKDLESAIKRMLSNAQTMDYYGAHATKMRIKFEANLGEFWLELFDAATGEMLSSYERVAETVAARCSGVYAKMLSECDCEHDGLYDLPIAVYAHTTIRSLRTEGNVKKLSTDILMNTFYSRFLTVEMTEIESILTIFLSRQNKERINELSNEELALLLKKRGRKMLPTSIKGLRYIDGGQPRLVLGECITTFNGEEATKEMGLAKVIFGKKRNLSEIITYDEIFETLEGLDWMNLSKKEQTVRIKDYKQRMRQLNYRLGAMLGTGDTKILVPAEFGITINHELLSD